MKPYELQKPYKGLVPYSEEDAHYFFARERECKVISANLMASRLTLLYGASGVGKSSLLRAGVGHFLEQLSRQNIETLGTPEFIGITFNAWRDNPVSSLIKQVRESIKRFIPAAKDLSSAESPALAESLQTYSEHADATLLITLDQFEEYFLYHPQETGKGTFAFEFARAVNSADLPANFLISIREDALAKLDRFRQDIPNLFENYLRLDHLDSDAAREAIAKPIEHYNKLHPDAPPVKIGSGLVEEVLRQVAADQPLFSGGGLGVGPNTSRQQRIETPYLQIIMSRLWDEESAAGSRELRAQTLMDLGGAKEIVKTHLDSAMSTLSIDEQTIAASIFNFLVTPSGTKIAHTAADLASYALQPKEKVAKVLEKIAGADIRLLRTVPPPPDQPAADSRYEIFHDVLAPSVLGWRTRFEEKEAARQIVRNDVNPVVGSDSNFFRLRPEIALGLSGGGYRSMLFHLGALWRLNELGMLRKLARISSVSAASVTAGLLGLQWKNLNFDRTDVATNFATLVVEPIMRLAQNTIDTSTALVGLLLPRSSAIEKIVDAYRKRLYGNATLQDLPSDDEGPRFVINATNVSSGVLWRFSKPYMGDYRVGRIRNPKLELAVAVAASGASLPFHSPLQLNPNPSDFEPGSGMDLQLEPYTSNVPLTDGGVYDKLALETVWKQFDTILISDGGAARIDEPYLNQNWVTHSYRIMNLMDHQVESLRKRQVISSYQMGVRKGTYWFMGSDITNYNLADALPCPFEKTLALAQIATRLKMLDSTLQQQVINWGYAVCDAAIRTHVQQDAPAPAAFPYPQVGGVG